ncbi:unnamed protein product [Parnassius mnemosyne]|uniref:THAP-type domain-containing protein n=1 Tax=Parnassius mnemosyne TaxID=213953 RepID=A0AAV1L372_9NEOP
MVVYCTACMNNTRKNKNISYFNYPKEYNRRQEWLKAVGREDLLPKLIDDKTRQQYRICEVHFEKSFIKFSKKRTVKYLFDNALPTLNLPTYDGACSSSSLCENVSIQENQNIKFIPTTEISSSPNNTIDKIIKLEDQSYYSIQMDDIQTCGSRSAQTELQLSADSPRKRKLSPEFREAKKDKQYDLDSVTEDDFFKLCDKFLTKGMTQIIKWQKDLRGYDENRYSRHFKYFALNLHYSGPAAYRFFTNTFSLPSLVTLQKLVKPIGTKLDERLLCALKMKVDKMGTQEKICSVCVDCMPLKANLCYDVRNDRIIGFHEINGIQKKEPAKYVVVMMIRGIIHDWKQPIAHSFVSQCKKHTELNDWIDEIITSLLNIGLDIRVLISDLGSDFLRISKSRSVIRDKTYFEVDGHKIYYMFDVPHLLKCVRNKLKTCNFIFDNKVAKWSHIRELYNEDKKRQIRLAPKLTDTHIKPYNFQKMPVKVVKEVLSRTVASAINSYVDLNLIEVAARDTADFLNKISNLFDLFNSSTLQSPNKYKRAFRGDNYQIEFLEEMLTFFKNLKLIRSDGQKDVTNIMNFIHGFQVSIKSLLKLHEDLKSQKNKFILTRRLNRDCLENFFGKVRQAGGNRKKPTCRQVSNVFNKEFIMNILKKPQSINCDQDFELLLMKSEACCIFNAPLQVSQADDVIAPGLMIGTNDYRFDLPEKNVIVYVSVYLYRKCQEHHKCEKIKVYGNKSEQPINMTKDSFFNHYKAFIEDSIRSSFLTIPPANFIAFVDLLERKFCEYFNLETNIVNIGNDIFKRVQDCTFDMPCECFPLDYLKKLYIRFRIYNTIKRHNKLLKIKNYNNKIFRVSGL